MSDYETKETRSRSRKRNMMAKALRDTGDHRGAFSLRVIDPRKGEYKRQKLRVTEVDYEEE